MFSGNRIYIRMMEEKDVKFKVKWINDSDVSRTLNFARPVSEFSTKQWLHKVTAQNNRRDFIICLKETQKPIGYGGFINIDYLNSKAESYMGIGDKEQWGKGYAAEIREVLLNYGFNELGLQRIYSFVWSKNDKMIKVNENAGFKVEGTLRRDIFSHGELRDRVIMSILKEEYINNK